MEKYFAHPMQFITTIHHAYTTEIENGPLHSSKKKAESYPAASTSINVGELSRLQGF